MTKIIRQTHKIDAKGQSLGRLASRIAIILRGKNKPEFDPRLDLGDFVQIENISQLKFTGSKIEQNVYHKYSGYPSGLKTVRLENIFKNNPAALLQHAVKQMLPANKLRISQLKRLTYKS